MSHDDEVTFYAAGTAFRVPVDADPKATVAYLAAKAARGVTANVGLRDENIAQAVVAWLAAAGLLSAEVEWGVHQGDADLSAGSIDLYLSRDHAMAARNLHGGTPVFRRATTWTAS